MKKYVQTNDNKGKILFKISICLALLLTIFLIDNGTVLGDGHTAFAANETDKPVLYLSDIPYVSNKSSVGWGSITYDKNLDSSKNNGLITLLIGNEKRKTQFLKGISAHANSTVVYDLTKYNYDIFKAYIGIDQSKGSQGNGVKFYIYTSADGTNYTEIARYTYPPFKGDSKAAEVELNVKGVKFLKLVCDSNGNNDSDHAVYANARLVKEGYSETELEPAKARYIKLVGKRTQAASAGKHFMAAKMFNLFEDTTIVANFSFDGEDAGKIILDDIYSGRSWKYSVDRGTTWKDGEGDIYKLPDADINAINEESGIKIRDKGSNAETTISFGKKEAPARVYLNDLENRLIGITNADILEWKCSDENTWKSYVTQEPVIKENKTLQVRVKATGKILPSDAIEYEFTKDTDTETSKYVPISHLTVETFSSTTPDRGEPATNAIDGNANTMWHTNRVTPDQERYIVIKLDEPRYITKLQYVKKANYGYGTLKNGIISTSMDGENWEEAVTITDLYNPADESELLAAENVKDIPINTPKQAKYIKIQCTKSCDYVYGGKNNVPVDCDYFFEAAMLNLFEDITKRPQTTPTGKLGDTDGNDKITTKDAKMILQHIVKKIDLSTMS